MKRVVITGMGIYSCIGKNLDEVKNSLYHGKSGIDIDSERIDFGFLSPLTGILKRPDMKKLLDRKKRNFLAEQGEYAYVATLEAFQNAKIDESFLEANEVGILYGNDSSALPVIEAADIIRNKKNTVLVGSGSIFQSMNSTVTMNLSVIFKLKGINFTISGACASGSHTIGLAYFLIKNGLQDCILCGGAQEVNPYAVGSFDGLGTFSKRIDEPTKASRPFDKNRDGLVPSGGAASLVVESYESAIKRGAPILAEVIGYGFSSNGDHISTPNIDGPVRSLEMCIKDARIKPEEIQYINAHATSTPIGDMNEAKAIHNVFGNHKPFVASTKSMTGHEMWMAGASEAIYSILMMNNNFIAPNLNFEESDEASALLNIPTKRIDTSFDMFLSNSFGFGGTNSTLIIKKFKE
ncbi:beta-ketoacyl-[acyl-carrier-protein] synthase family protein [Dysgonomonas sp. Marseille-P4677]|uniref:beta-ketoacyl-[acyl-carrier-protein] synthase family protein n=1 Tax=Dysgonomonas sp. Marseille-P4677 TaxID=2364790 RepID=UPI0019146BC2|nr:beta-ketoacyl-[acyl-carrier-protein] synthase family protein [Dysgonomonas sp. Marseille-P4677]MBK5720090.1 beta-ketoacyl-[acyl-carrier-protein] synthase family protein [Dysgonomonas sp. Marseille-P4677]